MGVSSSSSTFRIYQSYTWIICCEFQVTKLININCFPNNPKFLTFLRFSLSSRPIVVRLPIRPARRRIFKSISGVTLICENLFQNKLLGHCYGNSEMLNFEPLTLNQYLNVLCIILLDFYHSENNGPKTLHTLQFFTVFCQGVVVGGQIRSTIYIVPLIWVKYFIVVRCNLQRFYACAQKQSSQTKDRSNLLLHLEGLMLSIRTTRLLTV